MLWIWITAAVALVALLAVWGYHSSESAFWSAYEAAQEQDARWAREHPGCSWEDAHRHREAVRRRFHRP